MVDIVGSAEGIVLEGVDRGTGQIPDHGKGSCLEPEEKVLGTAEELADEPSFAERCAEDDAQDEDRPEHDVFGIPAAAEDVIEADAYICAGRSFDEGYHVGEKLRDVALKDLLEKDIEAEEYAEPQYREDQVSFDVA